MEIVNKKVTASYEPNEGWRAWKMTLLNNFNLAVEGMKFTKKNKLKEICINGIWYSVDKHERFTAYCRKIMQMSAKKLRTVKKSIPNWVTFKPYRPRSV